MLIVLGCNLGHYDQSNNIATAFSCYISGRVVASDGTVTGSWYNSIVDACTFTSKDDTDFQKYTKSSRSNYGWVVYNGIKINSGIAVQNPNRTKLGYKALTVEKICILTISSSYNKFK